MDNTIITQGIFTATGGSVIWTFRQDVDWLRVINYTEADAANANHGVQYYWQRGLVDGAGLVWYHPAGDQTLAIDALAAGTGFTLVDSSDQTPGAARILNGAFTTNATQPVVTSATTTGLVEGSIVRLSGTTAAESLSGFDFEVDTIVDGVSFRMRYAMANAPGAAATAGYYRHIPYDPIFYPRRRYVINITQAAAAVIRTSVQHGYTVGQKIRVHVPAAFGMVEIDGLEATVTAVTASEITTDIDSTGFTAFAFALPAAVPFTMPTIVPVGENTATALAGGVLITGDAIYDDSYIGITAPAGVLAPGGSNGDVIMWVAGKSFSAD